jgi:hypothetical protein
MEFNSNFTYMLCSANAKENVYHKKRGREFVQGRHSWFSREVLPPLRPIFPLLPSGLALTAGLKPESRFMCQTPLEELMKESVDSSRRF